MKCYDFEPREHAESLMLEAGGINTGLRVIESYCHNDNCGIDERRFMEYLACSRELQLEDLGLIYEGMQSIEDLINPSA